MARTSSYWLEINNSYLTTPWAEGRNILINGTNKYLNFGSLSGNSGYGFRDNAGVMQWKNSGGSWQDFGSGGGGGIAQSFETVSKNLNATNATLNYTGDNLTSIVYANGITKTLNYTGDNLTSVVLSGSTPSGIDLIKTLTYTGDTLTGVAYS